MFNAMIVDLKIQDVIHRVPHKKPAQYLDIHNNEHTVNQIMHSYI